MTGPTNPFAVLLVTADRKPNVDGIRASLPIANVVRALKGEPLMTLEEAIEATQHAIDTGLT